MSGQAPYTRVNAQERFRLYRQRTFLPESVFLEEVTKVDIKTHGIPLYGDSIGGIPSPWLAYETLLSLHAQHVDPEADDGPFSFVAMKAGFIAFNPSGDWQICEDTLMATMRQFAFNEDICHRDSIADNQVIAYGYVAFEIPAERPMLGKSIVVDCYYAEPTMRLR